MCTDFVCNYIKKRSLVNVECHLGERGHGPRKLSVSHAFWLSFLSFYVRSVTTTAPETLLISNIFHLWSSKKQYLNMTSGVADIKSMVWNPVVYVRVLCFFLKILVAAMASNVRRIVLLESTQLILTMNMLRRGQWRCYCAVQVKYYHVQWYSKW